MAAEHPKTSYVEARQYLRVIDETGEDYLYPSKYFVPIQVPPEAAKILPAANSPHWPPTIN